MIDLRPMDPADMRQLDLQRPQRVWMGDTALDDDYGLHMQDGGPAWTLWRPGGKPLAIVGLHEIWPTYAVAWALLSEGMHGLHLPMTRLLRDGIMATSYARIEAHCRADYPPSARWAKLLGFEFLATIRKAGPDLEAFHVFELVR